MGTALRGPTGLWLAIGVALVVGLAGGVAAQDAVAVEPDVAGWRSGLAKAEQLLFRGGGRRAERAREQCDEVYQAMLEWPGRGEVPARLLGETLSLLAVAEARLGETDRARWHWAMAQNVWPALDAGRFEPYPDVAGELAAHRVRPGEEAPDANGEDYSPPEPVGMVPIAYPGQIRRQGIPGMTEVVVVVSEEGVPVKPLLRSSCGVPGFDVAVMEAARQWTFSPARRGGRAVPGGYVLRAQFELGG